MPEENVTADKVVTLLKDEAPIEVTVAGNSKLVILVFLRAFASIFCNVESELSVTEFNVVTSKKQLVPIFVTLEAILAVTKFVP